MDQEKKPIPAEKIDTRYVTGVGCMWHDSIYKVGKTGDFEMYRKMSGGNKEHDMPCCPVCGSMLYEYPTIEAFYKPAEKFEADGHPGYVDFLKWSRGTHYNNQHEYMTAYFQETGKIVIL